MGLYKSSLCDDADLADVFCQHWYCPKQHKCCANQECWNDMQSSAVTGNWHTRALSRSITQVSNSPADTHQRLQQHFYDSYNYSIAAYFNAVNNLGAYTMGQTTRLHLQVVIKAQWYITRVCTIHKYNIRHMYHAQPSADAEESSRQAGRHRTLDSPASAAVDDGNGGQWQNCTSSIPTISAVEKFCQNLPVDQYLHILVTFHIGI